MGKSCGAVRPGADRLSYSSMLLRYRELPSYEADDGSVSDAAHKAIKKLVPQWHMKVTKRLF